MAGLPSLGYIFIFTASTCGFVFFCIFMGFFPQILEYKNLEQLRIVIAFKDLKCLKFKKYLKM